MKGAKKIANEESQEELSEQQEEFSDTEQVSSVHPVVAKKSERKSIIATGNKSGFPRRTRQNLTASAAKIDE